MNKKNVKKLSLKTFAFTIFFYAIYYLTNAGPASEVFNPFPGRIVIVYFTAFVDFAIASSIIAEIHIGRICYWGGIYWIGLSIITFVAGMIGDPTNTNYFLLSFILSIGYGAAILYVAAEAEDFEKEI
jgi:hypothetical protein